jgi:hypothetical protein
MRYPILAGFVNLASNAYRYDPGSTKGRHVPVRTKVTPPGEFSSDDPAQLARLQAARCLGAAIEGTLAEQAPPAPVAAPVADVSHGEPAAPAGTSPPPPAALAPEAAPPPPAPPLTPAAARAALAQADASRGQGDAAGAVAAQASEPGDKPASAGLDRKDGRGRGDGAKSEQGGRGTRAPRKGGKAG